MADADEDGGILEPVDEDFHIRSERMEYLRGRMPIKKKSLDTDEGSYKNTELHDGPSEEAIVETVENDGVDVVPKKLPSARCVTCGPKNPYGASSMTGDAMRKPNVKCPLDLAVLGGKIERVEELLRNGADPNMLPDITVCSLLSTCDENMLRVLVEKSSDRFIDKFIDQKLTHKNLMPDFLDECGENTIKVLIEKGLHANMFPDSVKQRFIRDGNIDMVTLLENKKMKIMDKVTRPSLSTDGGSGPGSEENTQTTSMAGADQSIIIVQKNDMEAFMSLEKTFVKAYPHDESSWRLLHTLAVYGTAEMVECIQRWTRIDWDRQHTIHGELCKVALQSLNIKDATALYLATCLDRIEIVLPLVKLAGEDNIRSCLQGLKLSNEMEQVFMLELAERLRPKHSELNPTIVLGHQRDSYGSQSRVFIVYSVSVVQAEDYDFNGLGIVKLRNPYVIKKVRTISPICETDLSNDDTQRVREAIQTHRDRLWQKHSNLNIITGRQAKTKINGSVIDEPCVVLYCSTKGVIPLGEDEFPRRLYIQNDDHINVIVREGFFDCGVYTPLASTCPHPKLKMGCEIGRVTPQYDSSRNRLPNGGGTLGPFVRYNNNIGFLTCSHVLFNIPSPLHTIYLPAEVEVVQPSTDSTFFGDGTPCGVVERVVFDPNRNISIDAAVVKITDQSRVPEAGQFSNTHHSSYRNAEFDELPEYNSGSMLTSSEVSELQSKPNVVKFGSRTDVTRGALSVVGTDVRPYSTELGLPNNIGKVLMKNQYLVTGIYPFKDFVDGGDSGSAVFCKDNNGQLQCIGMAIGYCDLDDFPHQAGIVTPIDAILEALGPDIKLAKFP